MHAPSPRLHRPPPGSPSPLLAPPRYLSTQHLHLRVASLSGSKPTQIGQAAVSLVQAPPPPLATCPAPLLLTAAPATLVQAAHGAPVEFDVVVERLGVPAGFNLRGSVLLVYTKSLQTWEGGAGTARGDTTSRWLARSLTQGLGSCRSPNNPRHSESESRHSGSSEASAPAAATLAVSATELPEGAC